MNKIIISISLSLSSLAFGNTAVSTFEDTALNGSGITAPNNFSSQDLYFTGGISNFNDGFAASNHTDTTDYGASRFAHLYDAIPGIGAASSAKYAIGQAFGPIVVNNLPGDPVSIAVTNTTYAYYSMALGDAFSKKFGGVSGADPDWFKLTITGLNTSNVSVGSVDYYLADFRGTTPQDYINNSWTSVDLSSLAGARSLSFTLSGSDVGAFGLNTPTYFAIDNLTSLPEPASLGLIGLLGGIILCRNRTRVNK